MMMERREEAPGSGLRFGTSENKFEISTLETGHSTDVQTETIIQILTDSEM